VPLFALLLLQPADTGRVTPVLSVNGSGTHAFPGGETTFRLELLNHTGIYLLDTNQSQLLKNEN